MFVLHVVQNKPGPRTSSAANVPATVSLSERTQRVFKFTSERQVSAELLSVLHSVNRAGNPRPCGKEWETLVDRGGERGKSSIFGVLGLGKSLRWGGRIATPLRNPSAPQRDVLDHI